MRRSTSIVSSRALTNHRHCSQIVAWAIIFTTATISTFCAAASPTSRFEGSLNMALRSLIVLSLLLAATGSSAEQPTFPLLQDGGPRTAWVSGSYRTCLQRQRASAENSSLTTSELGGFCLCYGRALADAINGEELEAVGLGDVARIPQSFYKKMQRATEICLGRMNPSQQPSEREKLIVTTKNQCRKEYHPEDTDAAAATVRERFCGCFAEAVTESGKQKMSPREALDYCSQKL
jgi:hypothetical protein